jgi:[ribosomal protein S5]-alanine N-acetyltransferase
MSSSIIDIPLNSCRLRPWSKEDAPSLAKHANNIHVSSNLRDAFPYPYTHENAVIWIQSMLNQDQTLVSAIDIGGEAVGGVGIIPLTDVYRKTAEIGYWLSESFWNRGIMTETVNALVKFIFSQLDMIRVQARIFESNPSSMRVLEKCGFHLEAIHRNAVIKNGKMMDEYMWTIFKSI